MTGVSLGRGAGLYLVLPVVPCLLCWGVAHPSPLHLQPGAYPSVRLCPAGEPAWGGVPPCRHQPPTSAYKAPGGQERGQKGVDCAATCRIG